MAFTISSKNNEKTFANKSIVNISSSSTADFQVDTGFKFILAVQYDSNTNKCIVINQFNNPKFLFKGKPLPSQIEVNKVCKIMIDGSDDFIMI